MLLTRRLERAGLRPTGFVATDYSICVWGLRDLGAAFASRQPSVAALFEEQAARTPAGAMVYEDLPLPLRVLRDSSSPDIARVRVGRRRVSDRPYEQLGQHYTYIALLEFETPAALSAWTIVRDSLVG